MATFEYSKFYFLINYFFNCFKKHTFMNNISIVKINYILDFNLVKYFENIYYYNSIITFL